VCNNVKYNNVEKKQRKR